jgi:hypothetical protein
VLQVVRGHKAPEVLLQEDQGVQLPAQPEDPQLQVVIFLYFWLILAASSATNTTADNYIAFILLTVICIVVTSIVFWN